MKVPLAKFFLRRGQYKKKLEACLRIVSFNVHFGKNYEKISQSILDNKNLNQADILLLQEIEHHENEANDRAGMIAKNLRMDYVYIPARRHKHHTHGLAILTKLPFTGESTALQLYKFNFPYGARRRIAVKAEISVNQKPISVYNVHLDTRLNFHERQVQLQQVMKDIKNNPNTWVILAGDMNTLPILWIKNSLPIFYSNQKKKMHTYLTQQEFSALPLNLGRTMKQSWVRFQLDSIYTKGFVIKNYGVEKSIKVSDHFPVWADLEPLERTEKIIN